MVSKGEKGETNIKTYLLLLQVLLVFELSQDEKSACMSAVSEFLLTQPCLSFSVLDAGRRRTHKAEDDEDDAIADMTTGR